MRKSKMLLGFYGGEGVDGVNGGNKTIKKNIHVNRTRVGNMYTTYRRLSTMYESNFRMA